MEISPAGIAAQKQLNLQNEVATRVLRKSLDLNAEQGAQLVQMMDQASGVGQRVDLYA